MRGPRLRATCAALLSAGCAAGGAGRVTPQAAGPLPALVYLADSTVRDSVAPGVVHHSLVRNVGPWAIHVLEVDRAACWALTSVKAGQQALGRLKTSELIEGAEREATSRGQTVAGGVNADFFSFAPPGMPAGASIHEGRVISGPVPRPIMASDSAGRPWIGTLEMWGRIVAGADTIPIFGWNRHSQGGLAYFDPVYGGVVDSAPGALRVSIGPGPRRRVLSVDSSGAAIPIPESGEVISVGAGAPPEVRRRLIAAASAGVTFDVASGLVPFHPREAVGGFPVLVRDSAEAVGLDSAGGMNFGPVRHPRTMVGLAVGDRRLLLVTVDGRQPGYSAGMTLRESAQLMRDLGATQALNLDGGGSTTMVVRRSWENAVRYTLANKPSDREGERPVGNAIAVISDPKRCLTH